MYLRSKLSAPLLSLVAGYVYCAVAALAMLDRQTNASPDDASSAISRGIQDRPGLTKFLAFRQFAYAAEQEEHEGHNDDSNFVETKLGSLTLEEEGRCAHVGFNGRWNKKADTCYCWWVAGTLAVSTLLATLNAKQTMLTWINASFLANRTW